MGLSCADCHGGDRTSDDMDVAMSEEKGFIGVPEGDKITEICLRCHADESVMLRKFRSSVRVDEFKLFRVSVHGRSEIATCITCHGVHNIRRVTDPSSPVYPSREIRLCSRCHSDANYMKRFNPGLPTDQFDKYKTSIHGRRILRGDIKVATCSDCHSAHAIFPANDPRSTVYAVNLPLTCARCHSDKNYMRRYGIPTDQYDKFAQSVHGKALLEKHDTGAPACNDCHGNHGAVPPGVKSISHVCGICHALNADMFSKSPHAPAFERKGIPQCEICHGNHLVEHPTDEMLGTGEKSVCIKCHREGEKALIVAQEMKRAIDTLVYKHKRAREILEQAEIKGMDVSDARYELKDIPQVLIKARTVIHTVDIEEFKKTIAPGFETVDRVIKAGLDAIDEYYFRRWGLGASTLIITILVIALYLKIRKIERRK
jgi:predicted CXXCH cytochrome family protein